MVKIEKQIRVGLPQVGYAPYGQVHAHSTGNSNSTAQNEADYMNRKDINSGFYSHVVGNGRVIQVAEVNRGFWDVGGGWNSWGYAAVELIESHRTQAEFDRDYKIYVELLRQLAKEAGIRLTLDDGNVGIMTHEYCTYNQPMNNSDHVDPYPYLKKWGISKTQFKRDIEKGIDEEVKIIEKIKVFQGTSQRKNKGLDYRTHVSNHGWLGYVQSGIAGTTGLAAQVEAIEVYLNGKPLNIEAHVSQEGWLKPAKLGGTVGKNRALQAFRINSNKIRYRAHVAGVGWQGWKSGNQIAGTTGENRAIEAIEIELV